MKTDTDPIADAFAAAFEAIVAETPGGPEWSTLAEAQVKPVAGRIHPLWLRPLAVAATAAIVVIALIGGAVWLVEWRSSDGPQGIDAPITTTTRTVTTTTVDATTTTPTTEASTAPTSTRGPSTTATTLPSPIETAFGTLEWVRTRGCVTDLEVAPDGSIWAACGSSGILELDGDAWVEPFDAEDAGAFDLAFSDDGTLVAAHWVDGEYTLSIWRDETWTSTDVDFVGGVATGPDGTVWAATGDSCIPEPCAATPLLHLVGTSWEAVPNSVPDESLLAGLLGPGDVAFGEWMGITTRTDGVVFAHHSVGGGVFSWDGHLTRVTDGVEYMWVALDGSLWAEMSPEAAGDWQLRQLTGGRWIQHTEVSRIVDMAFSPDGGLWAVSDGDGAFHYDGSEWVRLTSDDGLPTDMLTAVTIAPDGTVWFGTAGAGIVRLTPSS